MPPQPVLSRGNPAMQTLIFLHAAGTGPEIWLPQLEHFAEHFHVLAPDLGDDQAGKEFSVPATAGDLADLIDAQGQGEAVVCGLSLGAFVALQLAIDHPTKVRALVISGGQSRPGKLGLALTYALLTLVPKRFTIRPGGSKRALLRSYRGLFGWDVNARLNTAYARTLVLCGTKDRPNLPASRELAASIPGAKLKVIPGAGHLWIAGRSSEFNEILDDFLLDRP